MEETSNSKSTQTASTSIATIVQLFLLFLKLCKIKPVGNWNWWIIFIPTYCSIGVVCLVCFCYCVLACCMFKKNRRENSIDALSENIVNLKEETC